MSASKAGDSRSRGVRVLGMVFGSLFVLLVITAVLIGFFWNGKPGYWTQQQERIRAMSSDQREAVSEAMRNRMITEWSAVDKDTPIYDQEALLGQRRSLEIPFEDLNIWLAEEGIDLLAEVGVRLPGSVRAAMIDSPGDGLLRISCDLDNGKVQQVVSLTFEIKVADDGTVTSTLTGAKAGRLPLPTETAIELIAKQAKGRTQMLDLMQGNPVGPIDVPIDAEGGLRDGRLVGLEVREDAMVVTRETVRRPRAN